MMGIKFVACVGILFALLSMVAAIRQPFLLPQATSRGDTFVIKVNVDLMGWQDDWFVRSNTLEHSLEYLRFNSDYPFYIDQI